jgi:CelD/BcsL family acetyltransferase involved in cellulose biosynthesis
MAWRFTVWSTWPEVWSAPCQAVWRELLAADPDAHAYQRPEVVRAWAETRGAAVEARPAVALATHESGARALLPWVVARHRGSRISRRILEPAGQSLFGYHDPLVAGPPLPAAAWADFWEAARRRLAGDCDQALFRFVHPRCGSGPRSRPCPDASPVLPLAGFADLDGLLARCSANHRGDVRRRLRRLAERGAVDLWVAGAGEAEEALADFQAGFLPAYHAAREGEPDLLLLPGVEEFATRLLREGLPGGWGCYSALRVDGRAVAWHLGLCHRGDLLWWLPTYDPAWEGFSPGKALLARLLEHAIARQLRSVHFLTGGQPYKLAWQPAIPELRTVRWHSPSLRGRLFALYDGRAARLPVPPMKP